MLEPQKRTQGFSALREDIQNLMIDITCLNARIAFTNANQKRRNIDDAVEGNTADMCVNLEDELSTVIFEKSAISLSVESKCLKNILSIMRSDADSTKYKKRIVSLLEKIESTDSQLYKLTEEKNGLCVDLQELEKQLLREQNKIVEIQNKIKKQMDNRKSTIDDAYQREKEKLAKKVATMNTVRSLIVHLCFACNVKMSEHPFLLELIGTLRKPITLESP